MTDKRKTFHGETPKTSECVLCHYCGDFLHAPEEDIFWEHTANHLCSPMLKARIKELEAALDRQCDSMAFVLNHMDVKNWYDKLTTELAEDRAAFKGED